MPALSRTFVLRDADNVRAMWSFLTANWHAAADAGRPLAAELHEYKAKRSGAANRLYWQRLNQIAGDAWVDAKQYSPEAWHAYFAGRFIGQEEAPGGAMMVPLSTASLNTEDFAGYLARVEAYAATELGLELL